MNKNLINMSFALFVGFALGAVFSEHSPMGVQGNQKPVYAENGLPDNCRAIIKDSVEYYRANTYPTEQIMNSIDRNCGEFGHSWSSP